MWSVVISLSVCRCVHSHISKTTQSNFTKFTVRLAWTVAQFFRGIAICYVLPVLWMMRHFHTIYGTSCKLIFLSDENITAAAILILTNILLKNKYKQAHLFCCTRTWQNLPSIIVLLSLLLVRCLIAGRVWCSWFSGKEPRPFGERSYCITANISTWPRAISL